jgi:hypothetical protein
MQMYEVGVVQNIVPLKMSHPCLGCFFMKCNVMLYPKYMFIFKFVEGGKHFVAGRVCVCEQERKIERERACVRARAPTDRL